jgi:hypothetical protein
MSDLVQLTARLKSLNRKYYNIFTQKGYQPSENALISFEREIGFRLPFDFREYLLHEIGGLYLEVKEEFWPRPKAFDVGPSWSFYYAFRIYSLSSEAPDWMNIRKAVAELQKQGDYNLIPVLRLIGKLDLYCMNDDQQMVRYIHATGETYPASGTFFDVVLYEIDELEKRKTQKLSQEAR